MLKIRMEQMEAFQRDAAQRLEQRALVHVTEFFPEDIARLGDAGAKEFVRDGISRAHAFEFFEEADVYKFIDLLITMGSDFDVKFNWAKQILGERESSPEDRMKRLLACADAELRS